MRQLGEAGIAAWKMLADYLNISVQEAMDRVQKRAIDSQTATTAILAGMQKQFAGQMEAQAGTFNGRLTVMTSTFKQAMVQAVVPVFTMLRDQLFPQVTEKLRVFASVAQSGSLSLAFDSLTRSVKGLNEALSIAKLALEAYIFKLGATGFVSVLVMATTALNNFKLGLMGVEAVTAASKLGRFALLLQTVYLSSLNGAGGLAKLKASAEALNFAVLALGKNLYWVIPLLAKLAAEKIFGYSIGQAENLDERRGMAQTHASPPNGKSGYGDALSKEQAARRETSRQEYLNQDRAFVEQVKASQKALDDLAAKPIGGSSGSGSDKYSKFVQKIKEQARELKLAYQVGRLSIEEYTEALDKLAATKGLKDVHELDIIKQKWQALEPIWKQYQESIDKAEDARLESYEKGKALITQWNATEIEMERLKAATKLSIQAEYDQAALDAGEITQEQLIERKIALENQLFELETKALQDRLALGGLEVSERDSINRQILQLQMDHNLKMVQLELQLHQQRKTVMSVMQQAYAETQTSIMDQIVSLPTSLADAFASAAVGYSDLSDSLRQLAQQLAFAAIKAMILKYFMGGIFGGGMFGGTSLSGLMGSFHTGGIVGKEGSSRFVSLLPKFHSGGLSGDEQLAVLQKGEGVFTKEQMKAMGGDTTVVNMTIKAIDAKGVRDFFTQNRGIVEGMVVQNLRRNSSLRASMQKG